MAKKVKIDFSGVDKEIKKGSGKAARVPEGDYLVKIVGCELKTAKDSKSKYFSWKFQIVSPTAFKGKTLYGSTSLKPDALWSLRNLIHAATGKNVAGKSGVTFDPEVIFGKIVGAAVEDNEYTKDGTTKITSQVSTCFPKDEIEAADDDDEDEDDDEEAEDEDTDDDDDDDLEEVDVDEI